MPSSLAFAVAAVLATAAAFPLSLPRAQDAVTNPVLGDPKALEEGRRLYRTVCVICHMSRGGRGPNLFASALTDEQFLEIVINGRKGATMPAFGYRLSPDEVWTIHAYVKSTDHYE